MKEIPKGLDNFLDGLNSEVPNTLVASHFLNMEGVFEGIFRQHFPDLTRKECEDLTFSKKVMLLRGMKVLDGKWELFFRTLSHLRNDAIHGQLDVLDVKKVRDVVKLFEKATDCRWDDPELGREVTEENFVEMMRRVFETATILLDAIDKHSAS